MRATVAFVVSAVALAACTDSISIDDFAQKFRDGECTAAVSCDEVPDTATCDASITIGGTDFETVVAEVKAGTVIYDGDAAARCLAFLTNDSCTFTGFHGGQDCESIFEGTLATGAACLEDEECKGYKTQTADCAETDDTCDRSTACCPGVCTAVPRAAAGASCATTDCADGLYCSNVDRTCKTLGATVGAACEAIDGCEDPMYCKIPAMGQAGMCADAAAAGATCDPTANEPCVDGHQYCDMTTMTCTNRAAIGSACSDTVPCAYDANCDGTSNTCVAVPGPGDACTTTTGCLGSLDCTNSVCTLPTSTTTTCM